MLIEFEGKTYEFPDDASDDEIAAALEAESRAPSANGSGRPNVFDQFDPSPTKPVNVFDQFDDLPPGFSVVSKPDGAESLPPGYSVVVRMPDGTEVGFPDDMPREQIRDMIAAKFPDAVSNEQPSVGYDIAASYAAGVPRGIVETAMAPITVGRLAEDGLDWLRDSGDGAIRRLIGAEPVSDIDRAKREALDQERWSTQLGDLIFGAQDAVRGVMDENLYSPRTTPGEFARTLGEFTAPGSLPSKAARATPGLAAKVGKITEGIVGNTVSPALLSESAGQLSEDTEYEWLARLLGAVGGNVFQAGREAYSAPESIVRRATGEMADADWDRAIALQNNKTGVRLTGPEAIAQAKDGATALTNVQRYVEGSVDGRAATAPFFAARPAQVDTAVQDVLDAISPPAANPFDLGPRAAQAADEVASSVRRDINAQTRPLYQAAEPQIIPPAEFAAVAADPRFQAGLKRLRANPELAPEYAALPDNSVGVVDAVTKDLFARGEAMAERANPLYGPELGMRNTGSAAAARDTASRTSPEYGQALAEQEQLRDLILAPLERGPVGKVAAAKDTAAAGNALLPQNPMTGAGPATADATKRIAAQDPVTTPALVRQNLADRYQKAATETQEQSREFAGAKFHKDVAGNTARKETLDAVLGSLPNPPTALADEVLEILQATGRRKPQNSATSFNDSLADEISSMNGRGQFASALTSGGISIPVRVADWARRTGHRNSVDALADMFTDPQSVEQIRNASNRGFSINLNDAARRTLPQYGTIQGQQ